MDNYHYKIASFLFSKLGTSGIFEFQSFLIANTRLLTTPTQLSKWIETKSWNQLMTEILAEMQQLFSGIEQSREPKTHM